MYLRRPGDLSSFWIQTFRRLPAPCLGLCSEHLRTSVRRWLAVIQDLQRGCQDSHSAAYKALPLCAFEPPAP